jgi:Peptidase of plants and bacteria
MKPNAIAALGGYVLLLMGAIVSAEIKVVTDHNDTDHSTPQFKFKTVPSPSIANAAVDAKFAIVDGENDDAGGGLDVLHDGKLPTNQDEPSANFFFNAGTEGGRLVIDLARIIDVKQVNTYSWHTDTRAPQVYRLYGSDGAAAEFNAAPGKDIDPEKVGWKQIANVDTRPKTGDSGGQYGVSIFDPAGLIGKYRYLLLAAARTESDDDFGNTFFSEINVIDAKELIGEPTSPVNRPGMKQVVIDQGKYTATIDTTETPDLTDWAEKQLAPTVAEWYPQLVKMLPSPGYSAPTHFSITFRADKKGVADTAGTRINCAAAWFRGELNGQAKGAIVHEMVHVVQQYGGARRTNPHPMPNPGWLVEGIPDYIRWYKYEPASKGAAISKRNVEHVKYDDSYRVSANFLNWAVQKYDKNLIAELNASMREGTYTEEIWKQLTGKSVQDLGTEWKTELLKSLGVAPTTAGT